MAAVYLRGLAALLRQGRDAFLTPDVVSRSLVEALGRVLGFSMSLGWRRGLVDLYCYAVYNNALAEQRAREVELNIASPVSRIVSRRGRA